MKTGNKSSQTTLTFLFQLHNLRVWRDLTCVSLFLSMFEMKKRCHNKAHEAGDMDCRGANVCEQVCVGDMCNADSSLLRQTVCEYIGDTVKQTIACN